MSKLRPEIYLIAQNIRSLFNVGALFRCADVFGAHKIYLCGYTGDPPRREITKTALGAEIWIPWEHFGQTHLLLKQLRRQGVRIVVLETGSDGTPLPALKPTFPLALVVGNEVTGASPAAASGPPSTCSVSARPAKASTSAAAMRSENRSVPVIQLATPISSG